MATSTGEQPTTALTNFLERVTHGQKNSALSGEFTMVHKRAAGMYLIIVTGWGYSANSGLYLAEYTGNSPSYSGVTPIKELSGTTITANGAEISISMNGGGAYVVYRLY